MNEITVFVFKYSYISCILFIQSVIPKSIPKQNTSHALFTSTSRTRSDNTSTSASIPSPVISNIYDEIMGVSYDSDFDDETLSSPIQCSDTDIPDANNTIELVEERHSTIVHIDDVEQAVDTDTIEAEEFYDVAEADIMNEEMEMDLTAL